MMNLEYLGILSIFFIFFYFVSFLIFATKHDMNTELAKLEQKLNDDLKNLINNRFDKLTDDLMKFITASIKINIEEKKHNPHPLESRRKINLS